MLAALGNGVKGGKWYSLINKVYNHKTLKAAWKKVASNRGAAGVDKISIKRFRSNAQFYLKELGRELRNGKGRYAVFCKPYGRWCCLHYPHGPRVRWLCRRW